MLELGGMAVNIIWMSTESNDGFCSLQPGEYGVHRLTGIQPHSEEKEIVCWEWFPDTVDGWSPDTISLVQPDGMVEIVGSIPSCIS